MYRAAFLVANGFQPQAVPALDGRVDLVFPDPDGRVRAVDQTYHDDAPVPAKTYVGALQAVRDLVFQGRRDAERLAQDIPTAPAVVHKQGEPRTLVLDCPYCHRIHFHADHGRPVLTAHCDPNKKYRVVVSQ